MQTLKNLTLKQFRTALKKCSGKRIVLDTETTGLYWWRDRVTTVGFYCPDADIEGTIDFGSEVPDKEAPDFVKFDLEVTAAVKECLAPDTVVICHNVKFDLGMLDACPKTFNGWRVFDTAVMVHLYDSRLRKNLENCEKVLLGNNSKRSHIEKAPTNIKIRKKVWLWPSDVRHDYCLNDCRVTWQLFELLGPQLKKLALDKLLIKEMKYVRLLYSVEHNGFLTDPEFMNQASLAFMQTVKGMEQELYDAVGYEFNWRSNPQLSNALYENLGIPRPINPFADADGVDRTRFAHRGQYNKYATSGFLLVDKVKHPLGKLVVSLRETTKLRKTIQQWLDLMDENNVIHTNFNPGGARTGRLSSSKPNLQNITSTVRNVFMGEQARTGEYNLRKGFIARPGRILIGVDYKQFEIFMFGLISQDPHMLPFLESGEDIHSAIAMKVWGIVDPTHRKWSKQIALGLLYGMTIGSLMHKLDMTANEARKVANDYTKEFPRIKPWMAEVVAACERDGYLRYWSGRIWRESKPEDMYRGVNAIIQGGCADILSIAALRTDKWLHEQGEYYNIVNLVHDELIVECPIADAPRVAAKVAEIMQCKDLLGMPFRTDAKIGRSYGEMEKFAPKEVA